MEKFILFMTPYFMRVLFLKMENKLAKLVSMIYDIRAKKENKKNKKLVELMIFNFNILIDHIHRNCFFA